MATITAGDSTTMYYKDWGEGPFVAFRTAGLPRAERFPSKLTCSRSWRRSKGARSNLSSYPRQIAVLPSVCQGLLSALYEFPER